MDITLNQSMDRENEAQPQPHRIEVRQMRRIDVKPAPRQTARPAAKRPASSGGSRARQRSLPRGGARYAKRKRYSIWAPILLTLCVVTLFGVGYIGRSEYNNYLAYTQRCAELDSDTFYAGISLEGESLEGLTYDEALNKFTRKLNDISDGTQITVTAIGKKYSLTGGAVQMSTDLRSTLSRAWSIGRSGTFDERYQRIQQLKISGMNFTLSRNWNEQTLRQSIQEIANAVYVKGTDATVKSFDPVTGTFTFASEVTGYELDTDDLYAQVTQAIANGDYNVTIKAKINTVTPKYNVEYLKEHWGRVSSFTTTTTSNADRNMNIQLAASCFNGMRVEPGQTVSFNKTTGERTEGKGYRAAGAYRDGVLIEEPGGGVCQVSTTLYHAVVRADLLVNERSPHSRISNYVPIGQDAAVNWPSQDFKFTNNSEFPIYIVSEFANETITFKIYGRKLDNGEYIKIESEKTEDIEPLEGERIVNDDTLPVGTERTEASRSGARAVSYKVRYDEDGNVISRTQLATSYYPAAQKVRRIGTKVN